MNEYTFAEYQQSTDQTAVYPDVGAGSLFAVNYCAIGLSNEAGEVLGKIKKAWRDDGMTITPERKAAIIDEMGDVLWYVSQLANELGVSLGEICENNMKKLLDRKARGVIQGSGDNR
jgi:NTP pyrophosphatase (non-canonical NTP hydrolase)